jgi:hypothetical protein
MHEGKEKEGCRLGDYFKDGLLNFSPFLSEQESYVQLQVVTLVM